MPRKRALRETLKSIGKITPIDINTQEETKPEAAQPTQRAETVKETTTVETLSFSIPNEKMPEGLKEAAVGAEVTLQITGDVTSSDETGVVVNVKTIELV